MRYIVFKNPERVIDSIIAIVPKSVKTEKPKSTDYSISYGNPTEHKSGGLVFENLELLKHWFEGQQWFSTRSNTDNKDNIEEIAYFRNDLKSRELKFFIRENGAFNLEFYGHEMGYDKTNDSYQMFEEFSRIENYGKIWLEVTGGFFKK